MDGNNHPNDGFFHNLSPHLGQAFEHFLRGVLSHHAQGRQPSDAPPPETSPGDDGAGASSEPQAGSSTQSHRTEAAASDTAARSSHVSL